MPLTLTSDLVSRNCIESGTYLLYALRLEFRICCENASWDEGVSLAKCHIPFSGPCDLEIWPSFKKGCVWRISIIFFEV